MLYTHFAKYSIVKFLLGLSFYNPNAVFHLTSSKVFCILLTFYFKENDYLWRKYWRSAYLIPYKLPIAKCSMARSIFSKAIKCLEKIILEIPTLSNKNVNDSKIIILIVLRRNVIVLLPNDAVIRHLNFGVQVKQN